MIAVIIGVVVVPPPPVSTPILLLKTVTSVDVLQVPANLVSVAVILIFVYIPSVNTYEVGFVIVVTMPLTVLVYSILSGDEGPILNQVVRL